MDRKLMHSDLCAENECSGFFCDFVTRIKTNFKRLFFYKKDWHSGKKYVIIKKRIHRKEHGMNDTALIHRIAPVLLCAAVMLTGCRKVPESAQLDLFAMDTYMNLKVYSDQGDSLLQEAAERIDDLEKTFSVTLPESDISRINSAAGSPVSVSEDTTAVLQKALEIGTESNGALDITIYPVLREWGFTTDAMHVPDAETLHTLLNYVDYTQIELTDHTVTIPEHAMLDIGALAKGYTSDAVMSLFQENGVASAIISLGGNVQALGRKLDGSLWKVGVVNPFSPSENLCTLEIENKAVITSGNYERYFIDDGTVYWHILDSADGFPADNGLVSVTVVGESGLTCDALSTALFVEGTERASEHWKRTGGFEILCVTDDGRILLSEGLQDSFTSLCDMPVEVITRE